MTSHQSTTGLPPLGISGHLAAPPMPAPQQVPRPYFVLLLRGGQTRFFRTEEDFSAACCDLLKRDVRHYRFKYNYALQEYEQQ